MTYKLSCYKILNPKLLLSLLYFHFYHITLFKIFTIIFSCFSSNAYVLSDELQNSIDKEENNKFILNHSHKFQNLKTPKCRCKYLISCSYRSVNRVSHIYTTIL